MAYIAFSGMKVKGHGQGQTFCYEQGLITRCEIWKSYL